MVGFVAKVVTMITQMICFKKYTMKNYTQFIEELRNLYIYKFYWEREDRGSFNSKLYLEYLKARIND